MGGVLQSPQLWDRLAGAKCCCIRVGFGHTALRLTADLVVVVVGSLLASKELLPCELLLPISWPLGHSSRESKGATTLP